MHFAIEGPHHESANFEQIQVTVALACNFCSFFLYHIQLCLGLYNY